MKVLLADDEPVGRLVVQHWLEEWGYEVVAVDDGIAAIEVLQTDPDVQIAILDWMMPVLDGVEVCRWIRDRPPEPYVYAILLSARDDKSDIVAGLTAGADDYVIKTGHPLELELRLRTGARVIELQAQLVRAREKLRLEAMYDSLTALLNRGAILGRLDDELARCARTGEPLSVAMVDLDHFKRVNDDYGHATGDVVLRSAAVLFRSSLRPYDAVGRLGGEEFLLVLPGCDSAAGVTVAERLAARLRTKVIKGPLSNLRVTASLGVACTSQADVLSAEELLRAADSALYRAKRTGRDRCELATTADWSLGPLPSVGSIPA